MRTAEQRESRRAAIIELLQRQGGCSVLELSERFAVTGATVRADLSALEDAGHLIRTHGGAVPAAEAGVEQPLERRLGLRRRAKQAIAAAAAELVEDGDVIVLDASSSTLALARALRDRPSLTIVSNSLAVAEQFLDRPAIEVLLPGGRVEHGIAAIVGAEAVEQLGRMRVRRCFFSCHAVDEERGFCEVGDTEGLAVKRAQIAMAERSVALIDSSKWEQVPVTPFLPLNGVERLISDVELAPERAEALRRAGVALQLVDA